MSKTKPPNKTADSKPNATLESAAAPKSVRTMSRMARLKKGEKPEAPRENRQKLIKQLIEEGGRRMVLELDKATNAELENLYLHLALTEKGRAVNYKEAIRRAIFAQSAALGKAPEKK